MSTKRITPLPTFSGVGAALTATADLPIGPRYHVVWLKVGCTAKKLATEIIGEIRLKINGKVQRTMTATELNALNLMMGSIYGVQETNDGQAGTGHIVTSYLPIFLAEPWRKQMAAVDSMAWATGNLSTFQLEMDLANEAGISLSGFVEVDNSIVTGPNNASKQAELGLISKWFKHQIAINGTTQDITSLPRRDWYQQISFFDANISEVEVKVENFVIRKITKAENDATLVSREMTPVAGRFDLVFDHDDILANALPMKSGDTSVSDFQIKLTLSDGTPRNISSIIQRIGSAE